MVSRYVPRLRNYNRHCRSRRQPRSILRLRRVLLSSSQTPEKRYLRLSNRPRIHFRKFVFSKRVAGRSVKSVTETAILSRRLRNIRKDGRSRLSRATSALYRMSRFVSLLQKPSPLSH